jgi:hypothetical protein
MARPCCSALTACPISTGCIPGNTTTRCSFTPSIASRFDGDDLRKLPLSMRKTNLARLLARRPDGIFVAPFEQGEIGPDLFRKACEFGLEGLVSKHRGRAYRAGTSPHWIKMKNRTHPATQRVKEAFSRDPYIREKFTRTIIAAARQLAREYFERYPKDRYQTVVESWREVQSYNIEFVMKRLRKADDGGDGNLMIMPPLLGYKTDAIHFREESRRGHLDWHGGLYDWRDDLRTLTMRRILKPSWTPQDDERVKAFAAQGASVVRAAAALGRRKEIVRARARKLGCPFPPLRVVRQKWANTPNNEWRD